MKKFYYLLRILPKLGWWNVSYMFWYRISSKLGLRKSRFPIGDSRPDVFYNPSDAIENYPEEWKEPLFQKTSELVSGRLTWFSKHVFESGNPPRWFLNPFENSLLEANNHWLEISDFNLKTGDIKVIWEPSRFDWLTDFARGYRVFGEKEYLDLMNYWLEDWSYKNPLNQGPNWKCGQETSFRVMKLIDASIIMDQAQEASESLQCLVYDHLTRISGNINYAIAQDNNHGTSESAGLYIGAVWLQNQRHSIFKEDQSLNKWKKRGRSILKKRIKKLIAKDGTFSQRSTNYHRVVVDTMSWAMEAMHRFEEPSFDKETEGRLTRLGEWQYKVLIEENGAVPNIGANDGAMINNLHGCDYRDFRPSTQAFFGLAFGYKILDEGPWDETLFWKTDALSDIPFQAMVYKEKELLDKQLLILRKNSAVLFLKVPNDSFRQGNDPFHLDFWYKGENIFIDTGSYSYNSELTALFKSVSYHNTIQFDNEEPLPKISRFLNAEWIQPDKVEYPISVGNTLIWEGYYSDYRHNSHKRKIHFTEDELSITDELKTKGDAVMNLHVGQNVKINESEQFSYNLPSGELKFEGVRSVDVSTAWHSLYYLDKQTHSHLFAAPENSIIKTRFIFK